VADPRRRSQSTRATLAYVGAVLALSGCASLSPEEHTAHMDVYFAAARACERRNLTVHVERVHHNGDLSIFTDQDTRIEVASFTACYHEGIKRNIEALRKAGQPLPEALNMRPDIDLD